MPMSINHLRTASEDYIEALQLDESQHLLITKDKAGR